MTRPPFPAVLDSSLIAAFRSCPRKAELEFFHHWKSAEPSVHLHAGAAYAAGLEAAREAFYVRGESAESAVAEGLAKLLASYGDFECPPDSAKSAERTAGALEYYFSAYPLETDSAVPITLPSGKRGIEFSFLEPLDLRHPESGDPLLYSGRMDMIVSYEGMTLGEDDKTTSQLGASWPRQWDLRCFSEDTEVLTPSGWLVISKLRDGEDIAQYKAGNIEFVPTADLHSTNYSGDMIQISGQKVEQLVTPNHRLLLNLRRGGQSCILAEQLSRQDDKHAIPTTGLLAAEVTLPAAFQQYLVAVQADGSLQCSKGKVSQGRGHREHMPYPACRFSFSKRRKRDRLVEILTELNTSWTEQVSSAGIYTIHVSGFEAIQEHLMRCLDENKEFKWHVLTLLDETFIKELEHWDGWNSQYYTTSENNARFVQTVAHCFGLRASVKKKINHTTSYVVVISPTGDATLKSLEISRVPYKGKVWCLSVPSTFLLTRRKGVISVSGNSQFTGYTWGARRANIKLDGFLVRGVSILKSHYDTLQAITYRPEWQIDRWYEQLLRDVARMIRMWEEGYWDYNLDHACAEYGGCSFRQVCLLRDPAQLLETRFQRRRWDPVSRTETPL